jgi:hypothetical protein
MGFGSFNQTFIMNGGGKRLVSKTNFSQLAVQWLVPNGQTDSFAGVSFPT